jgi:hypothetical protein
LIAAVGSAQAADERQSLEELRNTVVNLLQALVDQGVMSKEKAEQLVKQAQNKAAADAALAAATAAQTENAEQGAIRVPYVPQIVKDEISKEVVEQVKPAVVAGVIEQAKAEKWGVPGALPDWLSRVRVYGDLTLRGQADMYAKDNVAQSILDFNAVNLAGGYSKAGLGAFLDTTGDRDRMRVRARLGIEAALSPTLKAGMRLASGVLTDPGSESQTLGDYYDRYSVGFDQAYVLWNSKPADEFAHFTAVGGRFANPWFAPTELIFARDLQFDGLSTTARIGLGDGSAAQSHVFLSLGATPIVEVPLVNKDNKYMLGAQFGTNLRWGSDNSERLRLAAAYYDFLNVTGQRNTTDSTLLNYTAPTFIRYGNTLFDISNSTTDPTINLFALAAHFRLVDIAATYELLFPRYSFAVSADAVRNVGYKLNDINALSNVTYLASTPQNRGYVGDVSFGDPVVNRAGLWRARVGYRYVMRDAVVDAWTDADFHEGGTNTAGYYLWGEFGVAANTWFRLRYFSGNEINGPRYGLDLTQLDLLTQF